MSIGSRHNRSKGARGPEERAPPDNALWCGSATDWNEIKQRWGLTTTQIEAEIVMDKVHTCDDSPDMETETLDHMEVRTGEHKAYPGPEGPVYKSCEKAEPPGEERVQGNQGDGRGFPKAMVPSAQNGDGEVIVCER